MISNPIFHDIIKSIIHFDCDEVYKICKNIKGLKDSRIFTNTFWEFDKSDQEYLVETTRMGISKADVIWSFKSKEKAYPPNPHYRIVHEVKTGEYDVAKVYGKAYTWSNSQVWIWGWQVHHDRNIPFGLLAKNVKQIDINILKPLYTTYLKQFLAQSGE